jgi:DNA modification methylase
MLKVEYEKLPSLVPWGRNPRKNDAAAKRLAKTIGAHGWTNPLLCQSGTRRIIAGHTRAKAAAILGIESVPVIWLDVDDVQADAIAVADNRLGDLAEWDDDLLSSILSDLDRAGVDLDGIGYSPEEFGALLSHDKEDSEKPDPDGLEAPTGEPDSKHGVVYQLGPHRIACGDCRDPDVIRALFGSAKVAVAVTSPPYASQRTYDEDSGFKPIPPDEYCDWFAGVQASVLSVLAADGSWFVNIKEHCEDGARSLYVHDLVIAHSRSWGWRFVDELVWYKKGTPGNFGDRFRNDWEPVFHFSRGPCKRRHDNVRHESEQVPTATKVMAREKQKSKYGKGGVLRGSKNVRGLAYPGNVIDVSLGTSQPGELHPAAYPTALPAFLIAAYSDPGDLVFDPFMGGGSTLIAADKIHRVAYGCELSPAYCDLIRRRWTKHAEENGLDPGEGALRDADA